MTDASHQSWTRQVALIGATAVLYALAAWAGLAFVTVEGVAAPVWPPTGVALAALLLKGPRMAVGVFLGAAVVAFGPGGPLLFKVLSGLGAAGEALIGWWMVSRLAGPVGPRGESPFSSMNAVLVLLLAAIVGGAAHGLYGAAMVAEMGQVTWTAFRDVAIGWAVGDATGMLLVAPALLALNAARHDPPGVAQVGEGAVLLLCAGAGAAVVYGDVVGVRLDSHAVSWALLPFVIWGALRFGIGGAALVGSGLSLVAAFHAAAGAGYFQDAGTDGFVSLQVFIGMVTLTGLLLAAGDHERNAAQAEVRQLSSAVEQSAASVMITDTQGRLLYVNPKFTEASGYSAPEVIGKTPRILRSGHMRRDDYESLWSTLLAGRVWRGELLNRRKDGSLWWEHAAIAPVRDGRGRIIRFVAVKEDITERKEAESRLRATVEELQRSNAELKHFASLAAHDLQEPLRAMAGFAQLLRRRYGEKLDSEADSYIEFVVQGAEHMKALFRDLMDYSAVDVTPPGRDPVDLGAVVAQVRDAMSREVAEAGASLSIGPLPEVACDRRQLALVLHHLIGNAVKFRHPERPLRISVGAVRAGDLWQVHVSDNGIGIAQAHLKSLFVLFRRLHTRGAYEGTGIGLAISRRIVERHGGRIWAESDGETGTAIRFTLPDPASPAAERLAMVSLPSPGAAVVSSSSSQPPAGADAARVRVLEEDVS
ncbi:hypothetical protein C882_0037 [Caenispirillum salinarum AK4]|uniref:histidine kinase n=1 Tax=Caenispirillum salinarum AK4 TaxID=1238182 RepID=K9HN25_9PROT|nr:MASE1 domain-containing protein [Caenispirillum salinarum]EKV29956.1 hypothetical protein C882_0037 [Caenispirillum salinarum AK4]